VTDASTPSGDSATSPGPAAGIAPDVRTDPTMVGARADIPDAIDLETIDLDAIEADLDRVESALRQLADGTYWDRTDARVDAVSVDAVSASDGTSASAPTASA
jgi:hypothetical protein